MEAAVTGWIYLAAIGGFSPRDLLIPAGLSLICLWLMIRYRKRHQRLVQARRLTVGEQVERSKQYRGVHGDLEKLMVEVEQLAKRFAAQLDAKAVQIEDLVRAADMRIEALQKLMEHKPTDNQDGATRPADGEIPLTPMKAPPLPSTAPSTDLPTQELSRRVCSLSDAGMAPVDIARELAEHVGKIELILSLRKAR